MISQRSVQMLALQLLGAAEGIGMVMCESSRCTLQVAAWHPSRPTHTALDVLYQHLLLRSPDRKHYCLDERTFQRRYVKCKLAILLLAALRLAHLAAGSSTLKVMIWSFKSHFFWQYSCWWGHQGAMWYKEYKNNCWLKELIFATFLHWCQDCWQEVGDLLWAMRLWYLVRETRSLLS